MKINEYLIRDALEFVADNSWSSAFALQEALDKQFDINNGLESLELARTVLELQPTAVRKVIRIPSVKVVRPK